MRTALLTLVLLPTLASAADISFKDQLAPILARRCLGCHDNRKTEGRFGLHTFEQMLKPGDSGERNSDKPPTRFLASPAMSPPTQR